MSVEDVSNEIQGGKVIDATMIKSKRDGSLEETLCSRKQFRNYSHHHQQMGLKL